MTTALSQSGRETGFRINNIVRGASANFLDLVVLRWRDAAAVHEAGVWHQIEDGGPTGLEPGRDLSLS